MDGLCIYACLFVGVSICLPLSLCVSACVYLWASVCLHVFPYVFLTCVFLGGSYVCVWLCACACTSVCLHVSVCTRGSTTWGGPQRERLTGPWRSARSRVLTLVPSWALPCGRSGPPPQTSPHCRSLSGCREKERGEHHEDSNTRNYLRAVLTHPSEALLWSPFTDAEIEAQRDWVPDSGLSPFNECHWEAGVWATWLWPLAFWGGPGPLQWPEFLQTHSEETCWRGLAPLLVLPVIFSGKPRPQGGKD